MIKQPSSANVEDAPFSQREKETRYKIYEYEHYEIFSK
jgi:hypothetical protein